MTIPVLPDYAAPFKPVPQVAPLTIRDGDTMLRKVEGIKKYLTRVLVPWINENYAALADDFEEEVTRLIDVVNAAIELVISNSVEVQDPVVAGIFNDPGSDTRVATDALYAAKSAVESIVDIINNGRLSDDALSLKITGIVDAAISPISAEIADINATIETGRLSDASIQVKIDASVSPKMTEILDESSIDAAAFQIEDYAYANLLDLSKASNNVDYGYLINPVWRDATEAAIKTGTTVKVLCVGDSTTSGKGSDTVNTHLNSYPSFLAKELHRTLFHTAYGLAIPPSDNQTEIDTRWTLGAGWIRDTVSGAGLGGRNTIYSASPGSGTLHFVDSRVPANGYDIYYLTNNGSGAGSNFTAQASGGTAVVTATNTGTSSVQKVTVTSPTANTGGVTIQNTGTSTAKIWIIGIEPFNTGSPSKIRVGNAGVSGSTTSSWLTTTSGNNFWNFKAFLPVYDPDIVIIDLGINDSLSVSTAAFIANMQDLCNFINSLGIAVLIKTMIPSGQERYATQLEYVDALRTDLSPRYAVIDTFSHYQSWTRTNARGLMADWGHGNSDMYKDEGELIAGMLFQYSAH